jgi:hypothetical protein
VSLAAIIRKAFTESEAKGGKATYFSLRSGLKVCARIAEKEGKRFEVLTLSRPDHPKGPSTLEAHTCAKHAGWGEGFGFKANQEQQTITIWKPLPSNNGESHGQKN